MLLYSTDLKLSKEETGFMKLPQVINISSGEIDFDCGYFKRSNMLQKN